MVHGTLQVGRYNQLTVKDGIGGTRAKAGFFTTVLQLSVESCHIDLN